MKSIWYVEMPGNGSFGIMMIRAPVQNIDLGFGTNSKNFSTHLLTLLITCAILHIEQMERVKKAPHSSETPLSSESDYINILSNERRHDL